MVAREGLVGMDLVEIAPPYDHSDITSQLGARVIMDVLATLVEHGHLGLRLGAEDRVRAEHERDAAAGLKAPSDE
jgi:agmatinase